MGSAAQARFLERFTLTPDERQALAGSAAHVEGHPYGSFEPFYQEIRQVRHEVPERVTRSLRDFRNREYGGAFMVEGIPLKDPLPPTPSTPFGRAPIVNLGSETYLALLATLVAEPFSYDGWDGGHLIHNKYAIPSHRTVQFGSNAVEFLIHTETPFRSFSPDYLALLCLRTDHTGRAMTRLADLREIIESLDPSAQRILETDRFAFATDNPAVVIDGVGLTVPRPIISVRDGRRVYEYVHDLLAVDAGSRQVLDRLKARVEACAINIMLEQGQLLFIHNTHMIHGRTAYEPAYDGTDRWLQRMLLSRRLFAEDDIRESRLIPDRQLDHYPTDYRNVLRSLEPTT
jgi:L-asparagine oxygenase